MYIFELFNYGGIIRAYNSQHILALWKKVLKVHVPNRIY